MAARDRDINARAGYDPRYDRPASKEATNKLNTQGPSKPTTENESEDQKLGIKIQTLLKGGDSEIHVRSYIGASGRFEPDALVIFGPTDAAIQLGANGTLTFNTGKRTKERGPSSGSLNIDANGGIQTYKCPTTLNFNNANGGDVKYALGVKCTGDYKEETQGERHIRATKLYLDATDIIIKAGATIHIQAGQSDKNGSIKMTAARFEQDFINEDKALSGQKTQTGAGEDTTITFDPRSTTTLTSAGTLQHRVTGDYKIVVAGVMATQIYGASPTGMTGVPLIPDRTHGYTLDVILGKTRLLSRVGGIDITSLGLGTDAKFDPKSLLTLPVGTVNISALNTVGISTTTGGVSIQAGANLGATIPVGLNLISRDVLNATAAGVFTATTTVGSMNLSSTLGGVNITAKTDVKIKGALIYLN